MWHISVGTPDALGQLLAYVQNVTVKKPGQIGLDMVVENYAGPVQVAEQENELIGLILYGN